MAGHCFVCSQTSPSENLPGWQVPQHRILPRPVAAPGNAFDTIAAQLARWQDSQGGEWGRGSVLRHSPPQSATPRQRVDWQHM